MLKLLDITEAPYLWPVLSENENAESVDLALHRDIEPRPSEAQVDATDPREEGRECRRHSASLPQECHEASLQSRGILHLTFPNHNPFPSEPAQFLAAARVTLNVPLQLGVPVTPVAPRPPTVLAVMPVPEAAVHEHHRAVLRQDDVGLAWEAALVQPEPEPMTMEKGPHAPLGDGVLP